MLIVPRAELQLAPPAADGRIALDGHHLGVTWHFDERRDSILTARWMHAGTEYIPALQGIVPEGYVYWADMDLAEWEAWDTDTSAWIGADGSDDWQLTRPVFTNPRSTYAHLRTITTATSGRIRSTTDYPAAVVVRLIRFAPIDGETLAPRTFIALMGDGATSPYSYGLIVPWGSIGEDANANPLLYAWPFGADPATVQQPLAQYAGGLTRGATVTTILIEQIADYLRIAWLDEPTAEDWIINVGADYGISPGRVHVYIEGQAGMVSVQPLEWRSRIWFRWVEYGGVEHLQWSPYDQGVGWTEANPFAIPQFRLSVPSWINNKYDDISFPQIIAHEPGTSAWSAARDWAADAIRPQVSISTGDATTRPICWQVHQWTAPVMVEGEGDDESISVDTLRWHRNAHWRNAWVEAGWHDVTMDAEAITELPPNGRLRMALDWDEGELVPSDPEDPESELVPPDLPRRFWGYLDGSHRFREPALVGVPVPRLRAFDHIKARLSKHFMRDMPSFQGWAAVDIYRHILQSAGVAEDLYEPGIDAALAADPDSHRLPVGYVPWGDNFQFRASTDCPTALTAMLTEALDLQWGWNEDGYFLRPRPQYDPMAGADWVLEYDAMGEDHIVTALTVQAGVADFRNHVLQQGPRDWYRADRDIPSWTDPAARNYIGEDWWEVRLSGEIHDDLQAMATARLQELSQFSYLLQLTTTRLDLAPDMFIELYADIPDVPDGAIWRIIEENGTASAGEGIEVQYICSLEAWPEEGS